MEVDNNSIMKEATEQNGSPHKLNGHVAISNDHHLMVVITRCFVQLHETNTISCG